ncbi:MAG: DNA polymerase III subunit alpha [Gammaproteobacteria bacterium]|jgi:DNA polymerase-3 subunit alpha|nr:DNA polymerase III subunit alpha [Gammaproteobacteria bacterium]
MSNRFVHLHLHSEYSLQDSTIRLKPLIEQVRERDMGAVALTDLNNMFAVVKHFKAATAMGVKPIFGADLWIRHPERKDQLSRLVLLCQNDVGYLNLKKLISRAYLEGQGADRTTLHIEWLRQASDGLIALSACLDGDIGLALRAQNSELAESCLQQWLEIFGNRFFLELQRTGRPREEAYIAQAINWSETLQVPVVATNDVRFMNAEDFDAHEVRVCICTGFTLEDQRRPRLYSPQQYLRSADEMVELFADIPEAIANSVAIANACNLRLELGQACLPEYPIPEGHSTNSYLRHVSEQGLERRLDFLREQLPEGASFDREPYDERLKIELDVIIEMGFPGYFLIVMDFIAWAKRQSIPVGPGRGSGAGSLVAYALDITDLDPLAYELLFERFLNPERVSMPDFDIDFCMDRRDEVIDYVADHYGRNQVSQIITYGSMAAKAVIRDVGRVMSHPYGFVDRIAKLVPFEVGITLDKALQQEEALLELYQQEEDVTMLIDMARSLEGLTRNVGKHAGGVVISPSDLTDFTPLYCEQGGGGLVSQYDKDDVEAVGLVKFDFLGLRTLTIIDWAVRAINARGDGDKLEIERIPLIDAETFKLLQAYQTTAVFQLESRGMKDLIRRLRPDSFEDIIALVALFRPGPLQSGMVDDFIDRKHGRSRVEYPHPALEAILKPTYGVILYQEQVMQIAQVLAGYSLGEADLLRRAMGKKKPEEMEKQRIVFTEGAVANEVKPATATYIFDLMEKFAGYGFNKSHSAAYALVSYQTAWLKAHYPAEFMAAVMSADMDNTDKIVTLIDECRNMKLDIRPPDINRSNYQFTAGDEGEVYYGLGAIKGVGKAVIESIIETRARGPYTSLDDFCKRIDSARASRRLMEALIKGGAMDCFSDNRAALMAHLPYALQAADQLQRNLDAGINDMFDCLEPEQEVERALPECQYWDEKQRLTLEKEALGLFLTGHPLAMVEAEIGQFAPTRLAQWLEKLDSGANGGGSGERFRHKEQEARVCGLVVDIRMRNSFRGREAFVTLDDRSGRVDVRVLPDLLAQIEPILQKDLVWVVDGGIAYDDFNNGIKLRADKVQLLDDFRVGHARALHIRLNGHGEQHLQEMIEVLQDYRASDAMPVVFHLRREDYNYQLRTRGRWSLKPDEQCLLSLQRCLGNAEFYFEYR